MYTFSEPIGSIPCNAIDICWEFDFAKVTLVAIFRKEPRFLFIRLPTMGDILACQVLGEAFDWVLKQSSVKETKSQELLCFITKNNRISLLLQLCHDRPLKL